MEDNYSLLPIIDSMNDRLIKSLKDAGFSTLSNQTLDLGFVSTGNYALNKVISGDYTKGIPIGMITQFLGDSSTGKTVFATHTLIEAQKKGYHAVLVDSENAYNIDFAEKLGLDPARLIYTAPETLEECFQSIEDTVTKIRSFDPETPIVIAYDSIAVSPIKEELEEKKGDVSKYDGHNMQGAMRAKVTGACLRKINPILRKNNVALLIINQLRSKVGLFGGETSAAGGRSLDYYLGVNLKCSVRKADRIEKDGEIVGIRGVIENIKNKVSIPFRKCAFTLIFDEGLDSFSGMLADLSKGGAVEEKSGWYTLKSTGKKFRETMFKSMVFDDSIEDFSNLRKQLGVGND